MNKLKEGLFCSPKPECEAGQRRVETRRQAGKVIWTFTWRSHSRIGGRAKLTTRVLPALGKMRSVAFGSDQDLTERRPARIYLWDRDNGENGFEFSGVKDESGSYTLPVTARDTTIKVFAAGDNTSVVEDPLTAGYQ